MLMCICVLASWFLRCQVAFENTVRQSPGRLSIVGLRVRRPSGNLWLVRTNRSLLKFVPCFGCFGPQDSYGRTFSYALCFTWPHILLAKQTYVIEKTSGDSTQSTPKIKEERHMIRVILMWTLWDSWNLTISGQNFSSTIHSNRLEYLKVILDTRAIARLGRRCACSM